MPYRNIWDPINRVWVKAIPAGWTFDEWRDQEQAIVTETVDCSPALQQMLITMTLERLGAVPQHS